MYTGALIRNLKVRRRGGFVTGFDFAVFNIVKLKEIIPLVAWLFFVVPGFAFGASDCCIAVDGADLQISRDDFGGAGMTAAIGASLRFLQHQPAARVYRFCDREYGARELADSLTDFLTFAGQKFQAGQFERQ